MTSFSKSASKLGKSLIAPAVIAMALAGCSGIPNNKAFLFEAPARTSLAAIPRAKPGALATHKATYGQTVEIQTANQDGEDEALEDSVIEVNDPGEKLNRVSHGFNTGVDKIFVSPISKLYGVLIPSPIRLIIRNGLRHLEAPGDIINYTLQGNGKELGTTLKRFAINSTLGVGGIFDAAGHMGIEYNPTDFGLTMADWGVGEGRYLVTPLFGPSTLRDSFGRIVDIGLRPQSYLSLFTSFEYGGLVSSGVETIDRREQNGDLLDNVIFSSPDPYVTLRSTYLQRRRARASDNILGAEGMEDVLPVIATAGE